MVHLYGSRFEFSCQTGYVFENQRIVSPSTQDTWTNSVWIFKISHLDLEKWEQIGNGQSVRLQIRISRQTGYFLKTKEMCNLTHTKLEQMPFKFLRYIILISRYEEKSEMPVCTEAILNYPAKQDISFKIKELCHLVSTKPEQMPLNFFEYLI